MLENAIQLLSSIEQVSKFTRGDLASKIAELEKGLTKLKREDLLRELDKVSINEDLVIAARKIKQISAQIDVILHAIEILILLPKILQKNEVIKSLSLGAGSSKQKRFDVETNFRVAEFTFIYWRGNDSIRLQKVFKDFYRLAEFQTPKSKELWVTDDKYFKKFLESGSTVRSATHKYRDMWEDFQVKYPTIEKVSDYYRLRAAEINIRVIGNLS